MSLLRPIALLGHGRQGIVTQGFLGDHPLEKAGYVRMDFPIDRGKRSWFPRARKRARVHLGVDFAAVEGTPVRAVHDGKIIAQFTDTDGAVVIYQQIRVGRVFKIVAAYWHLKRGSFRFRIGDHVRRGQTIALSGATGKVDGAHLHLELWRAARWVPRSLLWRLSMRFDPIPFLRGAALTRIS